MVHWHLSWLVYLFVELKIGAAIASLVLLIVRGPRSRLPRTHHGRFGYEPEGCRNPRFGS